MKRIVWNHVELNLPNDWEITNEGGSRLNGVLVAAPPEKAKLEVYWRTTKSKNALKTYESYINKLVKKGYERKSRLSETIRGHRGYIDVLKGNVRVYVSSWYCEETGRLFIAQLDGENTSLQLFSNILNGINCHPVRGDIVEWRLAGLGLKLYEDFYVYDRVFKVGFSYAYFMSRDKKIHVIQIAMPLYVYEQGKPFTEARTRILKRLKPQMTRLHQVRRDGFRVYEIKHRLIGIISYGYLVEHLNNCVKSKYIQYTLIKSSKRRLSDAINLVNNVFCTEW